MLEQLLLARTLSKSKASSRSVPGQGPCCGGSPGGCTGRLPAGRALQSPACCRAGCVSKATGRLLGGMRSAGWECSGAGYGGSWLGLVSPQLGLWSCLSTARSPLGVLQGLGDQSHLSNGVQHGAAPPPALAPSPPTATLQTRCSDRAHTPAAGTAMAPREGCCDKDDGWDAHSPHYRAGQVAMAPRLTSRTLPLMYRSQVSHLMPNWAW